MIMLAIVTLSTFVFVLSSAMPYDEQQRHAIAENIALGRMGSMRPGGKRSLALGRFSLRPGKRSSANESDGMFSYLSRVDA